MTTRPNTQVPKWALTILKYFLKEKYREEIEGDIEEVFRDNSDLYSTTKAGLILFWDVLKIVRPELIKHLSDTHRPNTMIRNNLKVSLRVFKKNKTYTLINTLSLSFGLAIALLIFVYVRFELSYEKQNPLADRVVRISTDLYSGDARIDQDAESYFPLGPRMASEFPEVADFTRAAPFDNLSIRVGNEFFREDKTYAVDSSFFRMFNRSLIHGSPKNLFSAPFEVVLTERQAYKYFNRANVIGESVWISHFNRLFKITGVIPDNPINNHLKFDVLFSIPTIQSQIEHDAWSNNDTYLYLLLSPGTRYENFAASLNAFNDRLHHEKKLLNERITFDPVQDIHLHSNKSYEAEQNGDATSVFFLLGVAIMVLIIAIVNYINLSTAKALDRAKEVGIRKVIGSTSWQLISQFFTEAFLLNLLAGILALTAIGVALPAFKHIAGLPRSFQLWNDTFFWLTVILVMAFSTLFSGMTPAILLSSFRPIQVLKGRLLKSGPGVMARKGLVVFQFSITIFLIIQTFAAERQLNFMRQMDLGLEVEKKIVVRCPDELVSHDNAGSTAARAFKDKVLSYPQFKSVAFSNTVPGQPSTQMGSTNGGINLVEATEKQSFNFYIYWIDADFVRTMDMELTAGQNYRPESMNQDELLVNEEAIRLWGITDATKAVGRKIDFWGRKATIIGVIKNFHQTSPKSPYIPMIFIHAEGIRSLVSINSQSSDIAGDLESVRKLYKSSFPNSPFEYFFLDQEFDKQYRADEQFQDVFGMLALFAITIACLGLFGLVSFTVANRIKEIGVRKVLGASVHQIVALLSRDFIQLIAIASTISIFLTWFAIQSWLQRYAFRIDLSAWLFIGPAAAVAIVSMLTIFLRTFQVSSVNPVESLRNE